MKNSTFTRVFLPLLAALFGYFLTWFLFGISALWLAPLLLGIALGLAYATEGRAGVGGFVLSFVLVLTIPFFVLSLRPAVQIDDYISGLGSDGMAITRIYVYGRLLVSSVILLSVYFLAQYKKWTIWFPLTPWLFLVGVMAFMYAPAVTVDCRYAETNYSDGWIRLEERFPWIKSKDVSSLPDGNELAGKQVTPSHGWFTATNCSRDRAGRPRMFSFRPSAPMLLAYRTDKNQDYDGYAAIFDPKTGQKLSGWHDLSGKNNIYSLMRDYHPYGLMGEISEMFFSKLQLYNYNQVPDLPAEFYKDLEKGI